MGQNRIPSNIKPMLARSARPFDSPDFVFEVKWDGTRCICYVEDGRFEMLNRRELENRDRYPELSVLRDLPHGTVLDGEIVVLDGGRPNFNKLQQRDNLNDPRRIEMLSEHMPATFVAFDQLYDHGEKIMNLPLLERRARLRQTVGALSSPHVIVSDEIAEHGTAMFAEIERQGLEGIMAKRITSRYQQGKRSEDWLKIKVATSSVFEVIGYTQREDEPVISALLLGERSGRRLHYKGKVGSGFTEQMRCDFFAELSAAAPLGAPPQDGPADAHWRTAGWSCHIRYFEKTPTGKLRSPVFLGRV